MNKIKYIGLKSISNTLSIGIISIEHGIEDYCVTQFIGTEKKSRITKNKLYVDMRTGRVYFRKCGCKYYLDEFLKPDV